ncbi:MAG TPA: histidinol-phosphate transaminase [Cyclobacteriaceae bacterium]|nr:histidinol-phosphate aminotransferase family protein [Cytophagales bacterium]HRE67492.1 histidinol-phosphate transaminase [Cyclobacteriaceae bacterium]HRF33401.1 histidinol-phosphate transaminase [Cyclobacteriaceae bacterium]
MNKSINRRAWFKSTLVLTGGLAVSSSLVNQLLAAPVSEAERLFVPDNDKLVRLGSNENPYGPSALARKAIQESMNNFNRYAFEHVREFKKVLAEKEGVSPDHIAVVNGSSETLCLTGMAIALEGGAVLSAFPTFRSLMDYAEKLHARWDKVDLDDFHKHDLDALAAAVKSDTRLMFLCNPNNPTGTVIEGKKYLSFCEEMSKKTLVFSDEAYLEFLEPEEQQSAVELVRKGHNVLVSRTFSKVYGLAGLRLGYAIGQPELIKRISQYQMGPMINQAGLAAAKVSLNDKEFTKLTRTKNKEALEYFQQYLDKKGWFHGQSRTNCVLFPAPKDGKTILSETVKRGFQIRIWDYQGKEWCRVSIGTLTEMKAFVKAFDEVVG